MRVLHIGKFYPPYAGGIERFSADLCGALALRDVDVAMLAHATPGDRRAQRFRDGDVQVELAPCHGQWFYAPLSPAFPFALSRLIAQFRPDLLHLHMPNTSAFWALISPAARRLPWLVHWHADIPLDVRRPAVRALYRLYRPFEQALLKRAAAVVATSPPYLAASTALAPWRAKTRVIALGIDALAPSSATDASAPPARLTWPAPGLRLLAVGRLSYYKGFDVLLRALAEVADASLVLVGSGECEAPLRALARELGVAQRVVFAGRVDDADLASAYAQAQLFCLPSIERTEAFGVVLLEAMRAKLPLVASAVAGSGIGHVVVDGATGVLVPAGDARALADAIRRLGADPALRARLGAAGHARWRDEFTLQRCADRIVQLYRALLPADAHRATAAPAATPPQE